MSAIWITRSSQSYASKELNNVEVEGAIPKLKIERKKDSIGGSEGQREIETRAVRHIGQPTNPFPDEEICNTERLKGQRQTKPSTSGCNASHLPYFPWKLPPYLHYMPISLYIWKLYR
ncbi:hypothetical protein J1N35_033901 [Gossypium stocksii]|uniref:Uncharacterized protein n=1 Tax=Gossypium stocksii TaxID=47602 RepID=A0A9D3ZNS8_9ROSI|nr:hypothetical protein J1N35_033901 [Gossypium stocksii]